MSKYFVYRKLKGAMIEYYELGECNTPRMYPTYWCDRRVCEGFWGDESLVKFTVDAMNRSLCE